MKNKRDLDQEKVFAVSDDYERRWNFWWTVICARGVVHIAKRILRHWRGIHRLNPSRIGSPFKSIALYASATQYSEYLIVVHLHLIDKLYTPRDKYGFASLMNTMAINLIELLPTTKSLQYLQELTDIIEYFHQWRGNFLGGQLNVCKAPCICTWAHG